MEHDVKLLKKYITNKNRISHSISTAENMMEYAHFYSIDKNAAYFCGLYHDIGKEVKDNDLLDYTDSFIKRGIFPVLYLDFKKRTPSVLHGVASAEILIREIGLSDIDIISAICSHTLGGKGLSRLSKYTFMIDFCEPLRKHNDADRIYKIISAEKNFDKAYYMTYVYQFEDLLRRNKEICIESVEGYNEARIILGNTL